MGNKQCSCISSSSPSDQRHSKKKPSAPGNLQQICIKSSRRNSSAPNLQHIKDREEPDDLNETLTPSDNAKDSTIFMEKSRTEMKDFKRGSVYHNSSSPNNHILKRRSSCSTIYIDDSTVSQPNIKASIKCVALAVYYHIRHPDDSQKHKPDIFDERQHPLSKEAVASDYDTRQPDHRQIYKFIRNLFSAAQLTAECAIVTLIYIERILTYAEICLCPANWKRIILGAILLASKVWDDQAVWNVDYCQILKDISVEDMNEMERQFLTYLNFNINVPSSVYAKYYFDLRSLADAKNLLFPCEPLTCERATKLEATSRSCEVKFKNVVNSSIPRSLSTDHLAGNLNSSIVIS